MEHTLQYTLNKEDIAKQQLYFLKANKKQYFVGKLISCLLTMTVFTVLFYLIVFIAGTHNNTQIYLKYIILFFGNFCLFIISSKKYDKGILEKFIKNLEDKEIGDVIGKKELIIKGDILISSGGKNNSYHEYGMSGIHKKEDNEYIYIIISDFSVLILPKRDLSINDVNFLESRFPQ